MGDAIAMFQLVLQSMSFIVLLIGLIVTLIKAIKKK